jgi:hypothetical protein
LTDTITIETPTGGFFEFREFEIPRIFFPQGVQRLRVVWINNDVNLRYLKIGKLHAPAAQQIRLGAGGRLLSCDAAFRRAIIRAGKSPVSFRVLDLKGRSLAGWQRTITSTTTIDLRALPPGFHLVSVQSGSRREVRQILVP